MRLALAKIILLIGFIAGSQCAYADHVMVLIARADSGIEKVTPIDLRKLYLGFGVEHRGQAIRAVKNDSDSRLTDIFLQNVMGMSARSYDRRLLTLTLQSGRRRPAVKRELSQVLDEVASSTVTIAFVWQEDVAVRDDIKVLRVLWRD